MIQTVDFYIPSLESMKKYPDPLFYIGDTKLLEKPRISIVGSRKPNQYARQMTQQIASAATAAGVCVVSGGAIGIDATAHKAAGASNTIMVAATGLNSIYPAINKNLIQEIQKDGLVLSQFSPEEPSRRYNFPLRNELVVALGEILVVTYADDNSGTMRSIQYAQKMGKEIYVLPHRYHESNGTNTLLKEGKAKAIYDIDQLFQRFQTEKKDARTTDEFLEFCKTLPTYNETVKKYGAKVFEYELNGFIEVKYGKIIPL